MNYQAKFNITANNSSYFSKQFDILITGYGEDNDERHMYFRKSLSEYNGRVYSLDTCEYSEKFHYKIENSNGDIIEQCTNLSLIPDLRTLLRKQAFQGANICIDITTLKQGILFLLIQLLINEIKPAYFFAAYTEPKEYMKKNSTPIGEIDEFDLYEKIGSLKGVPGFIKHESDRDILLIAPIGFDSQRLQTINEQLKPEKLIPVIGFPSFSPGWNITAIKMNYIILKSEDCFDSIKACEAASPFKLFELLKEEFDRYNSKYDIYVSPLGTRPHCLGAALFAAKHPSTYLIYDFPVEKQYRSNSILKTNVYDLSKFIG